LELHHIVVLKDKTIEGGGAYTIDFSPVNQTSPVTLLKMLMGQNVLGTVRTRYIPEMYLNPNEIKNNILCNDFHCFFVEPTKPTSFLFDEEDATPIIIGGKRSGTIESILYKIKSTWNPSMNLFWRNCQHFSAFAKKIYDDPM